jgi:hypothetical protein
MYNKGQTPVKSNNIKEKEKNTTVYCLSRNAMRTENMLLLYYVGADPRILQI